MRALLLTAALLGVAGAVPEPPLCRVEARYFPVSWPASVAPEQRFRRIQVVLRPGCEGRAYISFLNTASGRRLPEQGHYVLDKARPRRAFPGLGGAAMSTWTVRWHSLDERPWTVPQLRP